MTIDEKIATARDLLWALASDDTKKTGEVVQAHQWLMALEAAKTCEPVDVNAWINALKTENGRS